MFSTRSVKFVRIILRRKREREVIFRLFINTRDRIHHALKSESKFSSTMDLLGKDIGSYKR